MTLHSSPNSPLQKALRHRSDAACAAAITHALRHHYQSLINTVNTSSSPSSSIDNTNTAVPLHGFHYCTLLERLAADACLRAAQFTVDPKVIEAVMLPHSPGGGGADQNRRQSGMDELASSHSSSGVLLFMKADETVEAIRAIQRLEEVDPYGYFSSAIRRFGSSSTSTRSDAVSAGTEEGDEGASFTAGCSGGSDNVRSISQLLPPRYILHALATRLQNTPAVLDDEIAEVSRSRLVHLFLEGVHVLLSSLQAVVRVPGEANSMSSLDLAKSIWFAAPPGLLRSNTINTTAINDTTPVKPLSNEEAFDRDMLYGVSTPPTPPSMRVVLLYNLLVGRLYDDYFDEGAFTEYQIDGLVERVERGLCASILSVEHPFSLQFGVTKCTNTTKATTTTTSSGGGSVSQGVCGGGASSSSSNPTRFQNTLGKAIQQERSRFGRLCYRFKGGEKRGRSDQGHTTNGQDDDDDSMYHFGRKKEAYIPDPNEVDPRIQRWGTSTSSRRIRFVDEISTNTSKTPSPPHQNDGSAVPEEDEGPVEESYRSFMIGGMDLFGTGRSASTTTTRSSISRGGLEEVFMVPTFHSQYGLR